MAQKVSSFLRFFQIVNAGTPLNKVSKLLGHSSTKMTEKYAHHHIETLRAELANLSLRKDKTVTSLSPRQKVAK
jgi:integrase